MRSREEDRDGDTRHRIAVEVVGLQLRSFQSPDELAYLVDVDGTELMEVADLQSQLRIVRSRLHEIAGRAGPHVDSRRGILRRCT